MNLIDKLKNVFFEEVEEDEEEIPQTFAKKVELPKKPHKSFHFEEKEEDDDSENEEKEEIKVKVEEEKNNDLEVDIKPRDLKREEKELEKEKPFPMMFDEDDFLEDKGEKLHEEREEKAPPVYRRERNNYDDDTTLYHGKKETTFVETTSKPTVTYSKSYYEEKQVKGFRPSPIISPIYGIIDNDYHKEEVVTKRETRIVSTYKKPDLDSVRSKAFGDDTKETSKPVNNKVKEKKEVDSKRVYDVNSNKPQVNRVTLADADEYYNDLGLAYNVDYSDASRSNAPKTSKYSRVEKKKTNVDDNLFDLIDSMYNKED